MSEAVTAYRCADCGVTYAAYAGHGGVCSRCVATEAAARLARNTRLEAERRAQERQEEQQARDLAAQYWQEVEGDKPQRRRFKPGSYNEDAYYESWRIPHAPPELASYADRWFALANTLIADGDFDVDAMRQRASVISDLPRATTRFLTQNLGKYHHAGKIVKGTFATYEAKLLFDLDQTLATDHDHWSLKLPGLAPMLVRPLHKTHGRLAHQREIAFAKIVKVKKRWQAVTVFAEQARIERQPIGRPSVDFAEYDQARALKASGMATVGIARTMNLSRRTVQRILALSR